MHTTVCMHGAMELYVWGCVNVLDHFDVWVGSVPFSVSLM